MFPSVPPQPAPKAESKTPAPAVKSLKDRIEEAGKDPRIPAQVMEAIEKNKLNAVGHSGSKYQRADRDAVSDSLGKDPEDRRDTGSLRGGFGTVALWAS